MIQRADGGAPRLPSGFNALPLDAEDGFHPYDEKIALVSEGAIVAVYDTYTEALRAGLAQFGYTAKFSLQEQPNKRA